MTSFAELFEDSIQNEIKPNTMTVGTVEKITKDKVVVNIGLKSEGFIPIDQFKDNNSELEVAVGDSVEVFVEIIDNGLGHTILSREKVKRSKNLDYLEKCMSEESIIKAFVSNQTKGGLIVDIGVIKAFLPGSLVNVRPTKDFSDIENTEIEVKVIKVDREKSNIVVSRRAVLEKNYSAEKRELLQGLKEGQVIEGVVKNIAEYGVFVDLGNIDGLLHITDISWSRVNHPSEKFSIGQKIKVKILNFDKEKIRVSLGYKQLTANPWDTLKDTLPSIGSKVSGVISNITDYGAFVAIYEGIEGLIHTSELDWVNHSIRASKVMKIGEKVDVVILDIDKEKQRMSLSYKRATENPWQLFSDNYKEGDKIIGKVKSITDFGLFVGLPYNIDGLVHLVDLSWDKSGYDTISSYKKEQTVEVVVLSINIDKGRVSLGIKQLQRDHFSNFISENKVNTTVKGKIKSLHKSYCVVELNEKISADLYLKNLTNDSSVKDISELLSVGDEVEAFITRINKSDKTIKLSVLKKEEAEEKEITKKYAKPEKLTTKFSDLLSFNSNDKKEKE